jgi:hypothetical protein
MLSAIDEHAESTHIEEQEKQQWVIRHTTSTALHLQQCDEKNSTVESNQSSQTNENENLNYEPPQYYDGRKPRYRYRLFHIKWKRKIKIKCNEHKDWWKQNMNIRNDKRMQVRSNRSKQSASNKVSPAYDYNDPNGTYTIESSGRTRYRLKYFMHIISCKVPTVTGKKSNRPSKPLAMKFDENIARECNEVKCVRSPRSDNKRKTWDFGILSKISAFQGRVQYKSLRVDKVSSENLNNFMFKIDWRPLPSLSDSPDPSTLISSMSSTSSESENEVEETNDVTPANFTIFPFVIVHRNS